MMRFYAPVVACGVALLASAQTPVTPTSTGNTAKPVLTEKSQKALDNYLKQWEERMGTIKALETRIILTETEGTEKAAYVGEAAFMRPNFAKLFLKAKDDAENTKLWRHYLVDGQTFWDYSHAKKVVRRNVLPKNGLSNFSLLAFLLGVKADDVKKRYDLFTDVDDKTKFTGHYMIIAITPKAKDEHQEFVKAELALWVSDDPRYAEKRLLPARLWFQLPNKNQVMWEFPGIKAVEDPTAETFKATLPTKDWKVEDGAKP